MSTKILRKQLNALTREPEAQEQQTKKVKEALQKERKRKAKEAKAAAARAPHKIKKRNSTYFKRTAQPPPEAVEAMNKALGLANKLK